MARGRFVSFELAFTVNFCAKASQSKQNLPNQGAIIQAVLSDSVKMPNCRYHRTTNLVLSKGASTWLRDSLNNLPTSRFARSTLKMRWPAAEKEAHDKIVARKEQARAAATTAVEKVNQQIKTVNGNTARSWNTVKAKIAADMTALKADVAQAKHDRDVKRADNRADQLEWEAGFAIDYAIASVEQAGLAVLNAIDGRVQAEQANQA